jgi:hypothetical protein
MLSTLISPWHRHNPSISNQLLGSVGLALAFEGQRSVTVVAIEIGIVRIADS